MLPHVIPQTGLKGEHIASGAVTLIQRFRSVANLKPHLCSRVIDGPKFAR